jgi:hypothetical protein
VANDAPEYFGRTQVGTISTPALGQSEVGGTSSIINSSSRSRPRKGRVGGVGSVQPISSPLNGDGHEAILKAAGLGRRLPDQLSKGERMSDAQPPNQTVERLPSGTFAHRRRNSYSDGVTSTPIGSGRNPLDDYENLNYDSMPANLGELQQRLGIPSIFSPEEVA